MPPTRPGGLAPGSADARLHHTGLRLFPFLVCPGGAAQDKSRSFGPSGADELGVRHLRLLVYAPRPGVSRVFIISIAEHFE
ncbi:hypothetical protein NDU88_004763 [Pleurodeles waltl]|uniref:Uncharacterized protein n=1 Tax=Pleurodeles waltl TaxID=8319 RepID=A0AAV7V229_PLEWA|nr:hypothetical protein NDU88_004763 [Pleurodeles waltl]